MRQSRNQLYLFPPNKKAYNATRIEQAEKASEEVQEIIDALQEYGNQNLVDAHVIEECFDAIQAIEGVLRKYPEWLVKVVKTKTMLKCYSRGDYE